MIQPKYSNKQLLEVAKKSYEDMVRFCQTLDAEGYWREPEQYLNHTIYEILDMYLQAVMLNLAVYCGNNGLVQRRFMLEVTLSNPFGYPEEGDLPEELLFSVNKFLKTPPIVLQLCGLRDRKEQSFYSSYFLDSLFTILISFSLLEQRQSRYADKFLMEFYEKTASFINEDQKDTVLTPRYLFLKLSTERYFEEKAPIENLKRFRESEREKQQRLKEEQERQKKIQEQTKAYEEEKARKEKTEKENVSNEALHKELEQEKIQEDFEQEKLQNDKSQEDVQPEELQDDKLQEDVQPQERQNDKSQENIQLEEMIQEEAQESIQQDEMQKVELEEKAGEPDQERKEKRTVFDLTDEELMELQQQGKLKIKTPRMDQMKQEQERALKRVQDEKLEQIREEINKINHAEKLQKLLDELKGLVGLAEVKKEIQSLINLIKVKKMRESYHMPNMEMSYHMVFTGNPGTGKTTVARLVAQIYKELGILSQGHLVEVDRSGLVAGYVGQTAIKVKEVVEKALGGVLFIDEAYALVNKNDVNDFGGEAIDTLVKMMEDHRNDLVIIVAGYKEEMDEFLKANTGLISRFNKFIDFSDYTNEEMLDILGLFLEKSGLEMEEEAKEIVKRELECLENEERKLFGNGRGMRNAFETILGKQANRIVNLDMPTESELKRILPEDVKGVICQEEIADE